MDHDKFVALAKECGAENGHYMAEELNSELPYFYAEWVSGGRAGMSCWSEVDDEPVMIESDLEEYSIDGFHALMAKLNVTYTDAVAVSEVLTIKGNYTDDADYYGNYTERGYIAISVEMLYQHLIEHKIIADYGGLDFDL